MNYDLNPFQELYVTDSPNPRVFVKLFSDLPVRFAQPLFRAGNVVLKGTQGAGKSMLLNLLKPQIRLAYAQAGNHPFPLSGDARRFLGAGINLTRSGALDIGQRPLSRDAESDEQIFPLYFGDFINYFVVRDILDSVALMRKNSEIFAGIIRDGDLDQFAQKLARNACWFGYLSDCRDFEALCRAIDARIGAYRAYHQYNGEISDAMHASKTNIGEPIATTSDLLKESGIIENDTPVFVRIDQLERLYRSDVLRPDLGVQYRRIINKAVGTRDSRVFYKIGTRTHAWEDDLTIYGTADQLEHMRDFRVIDLDDQLRRKEDQKTWLFPTFASDAFYRRLRSGGVIDDLGEGHVEEDPIGAIFGTSPSPTDAARQYVGGASLQNVIKMDESWHPAWRELISSEFEEDPLEAILASAWAKQTGARQSGPARRATPPPDGKDRPWQRIYWRKERIRQALLQLAARSQQRLRWAGKEQIVALSGGNISIFLSICHEIWDAFLRAERRKGAAKRHNPVAEPINPDLQTVGIQTASEFWYNKISEQPKGNDRQRFVDVIGPTFRRWLLDDDAMSYPGRNGFSLENRQLAQDAAIKRFLDEASDYGDLLERPHTTKEKTRRPRTKWYLAPILSVHFQLPESHVKEPFYAELADIARWITASEIVIPGASTHPPVNERAPLGRQELLPFD